MPKPSSLPLVVAVLGIGVGAMALLNWAQFQSRPRTSAELQQEEQERQMEHARRHPATPEPVDARSPSNTLVSLGSEAYIGPAKALKTVTIGYEWTPEVQADTMLIYGPVEMISKMSGGKVRLRVVNLSDPSAPRVPMGLSHDGKVLLPLRQGGGFDPGSLQQAAPSIMAGGGPPTP